MKHTTKAMIKITIFTYTQMNEYAHTHIHIDLYMANSKRLSQQNCRQACHN